MSALKLLNEHTMAQQKFLTEDVGAEKFMYITGPFMQSSTRNRNGRVYPREVLTREVNRFVKELVETNQAVGELNHPDSGEINPDRAAILITELYMDGDLAMGKARVLPTTCGETVRNLIRGGVRMGVSSRGTGNLTEGNIVADDYHLITVDCVYMPSCESAYVDAVNEQTKWVLDESTHLYIEKKIRADEAAKQFKKRIDVGGSKVVADAFREWFKTL